MRIDEVCALTWDNIDLEKRIINIEHNFYSKVKDEKGKVVKYRVIEATMESKSLEMLDFVFRKNGIYSGTEIVKYPYKVINTKLGIENCKFYNLRESYATKSLRNDVEIRDVADILGHSKIEATENYYVTTTEESLKEASEKFEETVKSNIIDEIIKYE